MSLTQEQVKHIANLSRLSLSEEDTLKYQKDLNSIVSYMLSQVSEEELASVDMSGKDILPLRADEVKTAYHATREDLLACSPKQIINHQIAINNIMH